MSRLEINRVAVIGGGAMGSGIAQVAAAAGVPVILLDQEIRFLDSARRKIEGGLDRLVTKGAMSQSDAGVALHKVTYQLGYADLDRVDLEIEAAFERLDVKRDLCAVITPLLHGEAIFASNTSSISLAAVARVGADPGRVAGMHFFNPVPVSALVEVVVGTLTSDDTVARAADLVDELGKRHIVVRDSPGFATSRLGVLLGLEAIRMLEEGIADAQDIDTAMELGYRHPMGPLRSTDLVGLDVRLAIAEHLSHTLGERFTPPALLHDKVARGELGRKSGKGFYEWT